MNMYVQDNIKYMQEYISYKVTFGKLKIHSNAKKNVIYKYIYTL